MFKLAIADFDIHHGNGQYLERAFHGKRGLVRRLTSSGLSSCMIAGNYAIAKTISEDTETNMRVKTFDTFVRGSYQDAYGNAMFYAGTWPATRALLACAGEGVRLTDLMTLFVLSFCRDRHR